MGNAVTKGNYNLNTSNKSQTQGADTNAGGKNNKRGKSSANTPTKHGSSTSATSTSPKPHPKAKSENQNAIAEEAEDVESDQTPDTVSPLKEEIQTPLEQSAKNDIKDSVQLPTPVNNQTIVAPVIIGTQNATETKKTNEEEDEPEDSIQDEDSSASVSNLSSETPSHHATSDKIEAPVPTPTASPLYTTPHISAPEVGLKLNPEIANPHEINLKLSASRKSDDNASNQTEAQLAEVHEAKDNESVGINIPNENETEEVPEENKREEVPAENEATKVETNEVTVAESTKEATVDKTIEGKKETDDIINTNEPRDEERTTIDEIVSAVTANVDVISEDAENAENSNLLVEKRKISPSEISNTAEGDQNIESSSEVDVQPSAEELHVKDCLQEIRVTRDEAETLKVQVDTFNGKKGDRDYLHLSEMLMRKLYKLDSIESNKNEEIRKWKKDAVLFVKDVTQMLEDKVVTTSNK